MAGQKAMAYGSMRKTNLMLKSNKSKLIILPDIKNLHLIVSAIAVIAVSLAYGLFPDFILSRLFDFTVETTDMKQFFKATMGLYVSMSILWIVGIYSPAFWRTSTISNIFFMGGLAIGRLVSLVIDGQPSIYFLLGLLLELILACWGVSNLKNQNYQSIKASA